jgi:hypothetical protein
MSEGQPLLVRVDPIRLTAAMRRSGTTWARLLATPGLSAADLNRMRRGEPVPLSSVAIVARRLGSGPDDLLADEPQSPP